MSENRQTWEWFENLSDGTKDYLCRIFDFIIKHCEDKSEASIVEAAIKVSMTGPSRKAIGRMVENIDHIEKLHSLRPKKTVIYYTTFTDMETPYSRFKRVELSFYCPHKMSTRLWFEREDYSGGHRLYHETKIEL